MRCLIPFAADQPKTRLASVLSTAERQSFATAMLIDVLDAVDAAGVDPTVLSTALIDDERVTGRAAVTVDDRDLTTAVNARLADGEPTLVVMADLPLVTPTDIQRLRESDAEVTIAPGLGGGTNALAVREPRFRVDYHGASYCDHRRAAADLGASVKTVDSRRLATDVDEPDDLAEVLIHGSGTAHEWLLEAGFELDTDGGRVGVRRVE
ncbi:2-phospho-L-lactate guanylyltransferase [Halohasta salina]|uniref:2-phospho-L-lactate guanylyltransferase n=1 Tax=Halohasta salina TaxID=2961621 RepID=UPI0020A342E2|nr:2-phospho-L-lactate guanylyltransferase [Halohasta salina]